MGKGPLTGGKFEGKITLRHLAALAVLVLAGIFMLAALTLNYRNQEASIEKSNGNSSSILPSPRVNLSAFRTDVQLIHRPLYPYSIIPGGVESAKELKSAVANDPVIAKHYAGFDLAKARIIRLGKDRAVYVSYRLGNRVFWTSRKLKLTKGETLLTDDEHAVRTRCGNRISEKPAGPVSPEEPTPRTLETPQDPGLVSQLYDMSLLLPAGNPPPPSATAFDRGNPGGEIFIPPAGPIFWGGSSPTPPTHTPPAPPPPVPTPEPGTLLLVSTGLSAAWLLRKKRKV